MLLGSTEEWDGGWGEEIRASFFDWSHLLYWSWLVLHEEAGAGKYVMLFMFLFLSLFHYCLGNVRLWSDLFSCTYASISTSPSGQTQAKKSIHQVVTFAIAALWREPEEWTTE